MSTTTSASPADTFISEPVRTPYSLDAGPGRYRIGLVVLASDYVTERDFINMRPSDEVTIHTSRVRNVNPVTVENLRKMAATPIGSPTVSWITWCTVSSRRSGRQTRRRYNPRLQADREGQRS